MADYKTRKDQVRAFMRTAKLPLTTKEEKARFFQAMKDACMVGAEEERDRILEIIREVMPIVEIRTGVIDVIIKTPVLKVLGFEEGGE